MFRSGQPSLGRMILTAFCFYFDSDFSLVTHSDCGVSWISLICGKNTDNSMKYDEQVYLTVHRSTEMYLRFFGVLERERDLDLETDLSRLFLLYRLSFERDRERCLRENRPLDR